METEHQIIGQVMRAKTDSAAADELIRQYLPFIKKETAKFNKNDNSLYEDDLSIAMFAFYEAINSYNKSKGAFLNFASVVIKSRLIDFKRKEAKHSAVISLDAQANEEDTRDLNQRTEATENNIELHIDSTGTKKELAEFSALLAEYGIELTAVADNCPKQTRTLDSCHRVLNYAKKNPYLLELLTTTKKLPITQLSSGSGVEKKLLERHRKYLVAILLAYTNGFEIIRGHLNSIKKGGDSK